MTQVVVIGLDSLSPEILFDRFLPRMPHLRRLLEGGRWGTLRTCHPPITIPAWAVMFTGMDPGSLGLYGIHHRTPGTYFGGYVPTPKQVRYPSLWTLLSKEGRRVAVLGMPPAYPPPSVNGVATGDFLTPDGVPDSVNPPQLLPELEKRLGEKLLFDVPFRQEDRPRTLEGIVHLTRQRWALAREVYGRERWDLFAVHDIGPDRLHHAFLKFFDPSHPRYERSNPFEAQIEHYYQMLDEEVGKLVDMVGPEATILVASDHGTQAMRGCFAINEWLRREGYLVLRSPPSGVAPLEKCEVDWSRTRVWATGGYYSRIYFNLRGREPNGILSRAELQELAVELRAKLQRVQIADDTPLDPQILRPQEIYRSVQGDPPDLMAYFGDLKWRAAGTLGHATLFLEENDTGPDDAVHSWTGIYILNHPSLKNRGHGPDQELIDVAPTLLRLLGREPPAHMQGQVIADWV